jgi:hypothetical protein
LQSIRCNCSKLSKSKPSEAGHIPNLDVQHPANKTVSNHFSKPLVASKADTQAEINV